MTGGGDVGMRVVTPCEKNPPLWWSESRRDLGVAKHRCLRHCPRLAECAATEQPATGAVVAGVLYVGDGIGRPITEDARPLREILCGPCVIPAAKVEKGEPTDTGACGEAKGFTRHVRLNEKPCGPCRAAHAEYARSRAQARRDVA